jgi:hypothetical protein
VEKEGANDGVWLSRYTLSFRLIVSSKLSDDPVPSVTVSFELVCPMTPGLNENAFLGMNVANRMTPLQMVY